MAIYFFPGCKYSKYNPKSSDILKSYLLEKYDISIAGCCSLDYKKLNSQDCAIFVCPTCAAILEESAPKSKIISIYEFLLEDESFPWSNFQMEKMTIQDCWRTFDHRTMQEAIRSIIKKLHIEAIEIANNYEKADFCGVTLLKEPSPRYQYLAPNRLVKNAIFSPSSEEKQKQAMMKQALNYKTEKILCYCTGCMEGIEISDHVPIHLLDLITNGL